MPALKGKLARQRKPHDACAYNDGIHEFGHDGPGTMLRLSTAWDCGIPVCDSQLGLDLKSN
jgi:hypothetical protein